MEHVQEISVGSPASAAGLVPHFDYIIATDEGNVRLIMFTNLTFT